MLLKMIEKNYRIDEIVFIDTTAEYPSMYEHIEKVETYIDRSITRLHFDNTFEFYMLDYKKTKGNSKGKKGYGWCGGLCRWGTTIKKQLFQQYIKNKYGYKNIIEYEGIAADEKERLLKNKEKQWPVKYPLAEWNITEKQALEYCYAKGFDWSGLYEHLDRVSCWCCRNKNLKELKNIYKYMPETWLRLKELESNIGEPYKKNYTLTELEERFDKEIWLKNNQLCMFS